MKEGKTIIISLGGSLIVPEEIDIKWISEFREFILKKIKDGYKFVLICGGGKTARKYQNAAKELSKSSNESLDWIGIKSTILNASLINAVFEDFSHKEVIINPTERIDFKEKVLVASGWKPGCSTDFDAVLLAKNLNAKKLINLSNIDYVYDKDPKKFPDAKIIKETSWKELRKILPEKWEPGLNAPFDPVAAKESEKLKLEVAIMNGKNIPNLEKYLNGDEFIGTRIK